VQLALKAHVSNQTPKIGIDNILVPVDMPRLSRIYGNINEVAIQAKLDVSLWNKNPSRHFRTATASAQDEFIFESKHRPARLKFIDDVAGNAATLQFQILIDEEYEAQATEGCFCRFTCARDDHVLWGFERRK